MKKPTARLLRAETERLDRLIVQLDRLAELIRAVKPRVVLRAIAEQRSSLVDYRALLRSQQRATSIRKDGRRKPRRGR